MPTRSNRASVTRRVAALVVLIACSASGVIAGDGEPDRPRRVFVVAGPKSHGPEGNGIHDYPWSARLIQAMFARSNVAERVAVRYHLDGWPIDDRVLDEADAIVVISDGGTDRFDAAPHLATPARVERVRGLVERGCGIVVIHFSTFGPDPLAAEMFDWYGGYFDWVTDGKPNWYSAIKTLETDVSGASPEHPVARGVAPFRMREEFYYNIRFAPDAAPITPILRVPALDGRDELGKVVAWTRERPNGGRGFATTCGHFYDNWRVPAFRKMLLNAIAWSARAEVPEGGIEAPYLNHQEIHAYRAQALFAPENLTAWCVRPPFDAKHRNAGERAAMLRRLGLTRLAYNHRERGMAGFDDEVAALADVGGEVAAIWLSVEEGPVSAERMRELPSTRAVLDAIRRHQLRTQIWVHLGEADTAAMQPQEKIDAFAEPLGWLADEAAKLGCTVGLYNHGGWHGEPENQIAIVRALARPNVGLVYNLHHAHDQIDRLPALLTAMRPYLIAINLNGMADDRPVGDRKVIPIGAGEADEQVLRQIVESGYDGPIGILGHSDDDVAERLSDNLLGLRWISLKLAGHAPGPRPAMSTAP